MTDRHTDLPLFRWEPPPCDVIPFPSERRIGTARKVAQQLARARTKKEAESVMTRYTESALKNFNRAGISRDEVNKQIEAFHRAIAAECIRIGSQWRPIFPEDKRAASEPQGAA